jgi:glycerophosphoryl diester phosphodiesterase
VQLVRLLPAILAAIMLPGAPALAADDRMSAVPLVIAHRGASGTLPEHTLEAYTRAIVQGADFIEPDLVMTKDGVLIARHEPMLSATTDVAQRAEFTARRTTRLLDGVSVADWFASDFTLAEIKRLRAKQQIAERDQSFNGHFAIPTFAEVIALAKRASTESGRTIGLYPETKHPYFHREAGLPLETPLIAALAAEGWTEKTSPVIVQSFETANLRALRARSNIRLVQLIGAPNTRPYDLAAAGDPRTYKDLVAPGGLIAIKAYADGIGVPKDLLVAAVSGAGLVPSPLVADAHAAGLFLHAYTFRNEARFRTPGLSEDPLAEYGAFYGLGVDGVFSDFPDTALRARQRGPGQ